MLPDNTSLGFQSRHSLEHQTQLRKDYGTTGHTRYTMRDSDTGRCNLGSIPRTVAHLSM